MKPTDLAQVQAPESVTLSPDGRTVVFSLKTIDLDNDKYVSRLWRVPTDGSAPPAQVTRGEMDAYPRFSPDGRWVAFLRAKEDSPPQLHVMPSDGGEPWAITTKEQHPLGVEAPVWSPDSATIAYLARVPEQGRYGTVEKKGPEKEAPRRIKVLSYRRDGLGYRNDRPPQIFTIDPLADKPEPKRLTEGEFEHGRVSWSPDGRSLAFTSARHEDRFRAMLNDVWVMDLDGGRTRQLTETRISCDQPAFSRDGSAVYFAGQEPENDGMDWFARQVGAFAVPADGSGPAVRLSDVEKYTLEGHFGLGAQGVLYTNQNRGALELLEFGADGADGAEPRLIVGGNRQVGAVDTATGCMAAVIADPGSHGEVVFLDGTGERVLTSYGKRWAEASTVFAMEEITASAPDGYPVHGWVVRPEGDGPHPVLLMIHGGPFAQYGWRLFDEVQVYAGAGYAVVFGNPRGSSGYGHAHGRHIAGDVGNRSAADVLALLDHALADPRLDAGRVGVLGGSHGGYMVTWLVGHTDRFRAAVSERAVNAIDSFIGTSDVGWLFTSLYGEDPEQRRVQSPLTHADRIDTPLLIIHSENDLRCPFEQGQRLFQALAGRGARVEMLAFPGEGHEMSRSGLPSHRLARFDAILEWFGRYMKD